MTALSTSQPPAAAVTFTEETLRRAATLASEAYTPVWTGSSGEESSGELVARHMEAAIAVLDTDGWIRTHTYTAPVSNLNLLLDGPSETVESMLRGLIAFIREDETGNGARTLDSALRRVGDVGEHGDTDTASVAQRVLDLVIQAHTSVSHARATPWSERQHRTREDIIALLVAGARFARAYGPKA